MIIHGDCVEELKKLEENSVDAVVTDPPYGLSFMGRKWDYDVPSEEVWRECLRVLKPGGHLLAFAGTRTQHRMAVRIEDAGFEIRDMIAWVYGSGFPKSLDVSKAIDKAVGVEGGRGEVKSDRHAAMIRTGRVGAGKQECWARDAHTDPDRIDATAREYLPGSEPAQQFKGWGTALKPALEPITVARKPLIGTVAENVLAHGTGALNIDGCRVATNGEQPKGSGARESWRAMEGRSDLQPHGENITPDAGRWPANLIHDGSDEVLACFPQAPGQQGRARTDGAAQGNNTYGALNHVTNRPEPRGDAGSAARFFYCAKASKRDRDEGLEHMAKDTTDDGRATPIDNPYLRGKTERHNTHPTVKPTDLMRYLCRLVTPPGGLVLDPFAGSGSTGKAAVLEGFRFIGIEREAEYVEIARARIPQTLFD